MAYTPLTPAEADPDSPLTTTLMNKIKDNLDFLKSKADGIPAAAWSGLRPAPAVDVAHDVTVASGAARDTTDATTLVLAAARTKQLDARWAGGTDAGGLANAPLIALNTTVSFDNATSKILGIGLFGGAGAGDRIIVVGSAVNSGIHEVTAATADDATLSIAPVTEGVGQAITVYIVKANWLYNIFIADDGAGGAEIGFDDSLTAANFLALAGVGTLYRGVGYVTTDATANIAEIAWIGRPRLRVDQAVGATAANYSWRKSAMLDFIDVQLCGSGQGGQNGTGGNDPSNGRGGSSAGYARKRIPAVDLNATETVTIPVGGPSSLQAGATCNFGAHLSATGGATNLPGIGSGGDLVAQGAVNIGRAGGTSFFGGSSLATTDAVTPGVGGTGGTGSLANRSGGRGGPAAVIIEEHFG